jgi:UPF0176 protein
MPSSVHIAGYRFVELGDLAVLREAFSNKCLALQLKGTILLSPEGINIMLAGSPVSILAFKAYLNNDSRFFEMSFRETQTDQIPFSFMLVKLKDEIIPMGLNIKPEKRRGSDLDPEMFKQWLDEGRDVAVLDTRNTYEMEVGTFDGSIDLKIDNFRNFPSAVNKLDESLKNKPLVMFCTGGVRCEKASLYMEQQGFKEVYQLEGGILNYFEKCGDAHYHGDCFVFDDRVALNPQLEGQ